MAKGEEKVSLNKLKYEALQARADKADELIRTLSDIRGTVEDVRGVLREVRRTGREVMGARAKANKEANDDLDEYKRACDASFKQKKSKLVISALDRVMKTILYVDQRSNKFPWAYYNFIDKYSFCSQTAVKLLGFKKEHSHRGLGSFLAYYIREKDRKGIIESLTAGEALRHYRARTRGRRGKKSEKLSLSTYPFYYQMNPVGVAIFLRDFRRSIYRKNLAEFAEAIEKAGLETIDQLDSI